MTLDEPLPLVLLPQVAYSGPTYRGVGHYHNIFMKLGKATPFNMVWKLQQFTSMLSILASEEPNGLC